MKTLLLAIPLFTLILVAVSCEADADNYTGPVPKYPPPLIDHRFSDTMWDELAMVVRDGADCAHAWNVGQRIRPRLDNWGALPDRVKKEIGEQFIIIHELTNLLPGNCRCMKTAYYLTSAVGDYQRYKELKQAAHGFYEFHSSGSVKRLPQC
ncbi:MAG: hypothetical protein ACR2PJ_05960 [Pseudomonadales bacterium]